MFAQNAIGFWSASASASYPACLDDANHWWYDATDLTTITKDGSNLVSVWAAKGGAATGKNLLQADGAKQPLWVAPGTIRFDGVDNFLRANFTWNQPEFIYMIVKQITWTSYDRFFDGKGDSVMACQQRTLTPQLQIRAGSAVATNGDLTLNTWAVVRFLFNGAGSKIQINNNAATTGNVGTNNAEGFTLGTRGNAADGFSNIEVKDIICCDTTDAANETEIYNFLLSRKP